MSTTKFESDLMHLDLDQIQVPSTNPRKIFDQKALEELCESIKQTGVLQPILVRPRLQGGFWLVCGERRFRATTMAGFESIPANIRDLTDDQAFEAQIIENLERKDVHPLDEAEAFQSMIDCGRYTTADIAAKMAKSETFVVQRLKLNDLVPDIKKDFFDGELGIGQAVIIARMDEEHQLGLLKTFKNNYPVSGYGTQKQLLQEVNNKSLDLAKAIFSLEKDFTHARACTFCPKRSTSNPLLFADMQDTDSCFDKACHALKSDGHIEKEVTEILLSGKDIPLMVTPGYEANAIITGLAKEYDVPILMLNKDCYGYDTPGTKKKKAFYITGADKGRYKQVYIKVVAAESKSSAPAAAPELEEINKIKTRAARSLELDQEKIHLAIKESLKVELEKKTDLPFNLDDSFVSAMVFFIMYETSSMWYVRRDIENIIGFKIDYNNGVDAVQEQILKITPEQKKHIMVRVLFEKCKGSSDGSSVDGQIIRKLANANPNIPVKTIESNQKAIATARIAKTTERIENLKKSAAASN